MKKPTILTFSHYYLPGFKAGGPTRTIANMVEHLSNEFDFKIVTSDRDAGDASPYDSVQVDSWNAVGSAKVFYASPKGRSLTNLKCLISNTPHDVMYLNGFFSPQFTFRPLLVRRLSAQQVQVPLVLAPRGEFSEGALAIRRLKKMAYMIAVRSIGLYEGIHWQASSEFERRDVERAFAVPQKSIVVARNLPPPLTHARQPDGASRRRQPGEPLRICFLSRITAMKNLSFALKALRYTSIPIRFAIYGAVSDQKYWLHCQKLIEELPETVTVHYGGPVPHEKVPDVFAQEDLFFLPTRGENYGHVIHESLAAGTPVLISDQTPWRNLQKEGVGWDLPLQSPESFVAAIESFASMPHVVAAQQRVRAQEYARAVTVDERTIQSNIELFRKALENTSLL